MQRELSPLPPPMGVTDQTTFYRWLLSLAVRVRDTGQLRDDQLVVPPYRQHNEMQAIQGGAAGDRQHWSTQEKVDEQVRHWITVEG